MRLSADQILDEVAERTDAWYRRIWRTCSPDEQLVHNLEHGYVIVYFSCSGLSERACGNLQNDIRTRSCLVNYLAP